MQDLCPNSTNNTRTKDIRSISVKELWKKSNADSDIDSMRSASDRYDFFLSGLQRYRPPIVLKCAQHEKVV